MRKQTRVLAAAALFTLGASFSAFAAKKGDWVLEDEGWMCLDKNGVAYTDEWCLSNGKEFYVDGSGYMVTSSWIDDGDARYYVNSEGLKTVNDWRFLAPYEDEDEEYQWFYFKNTGKMASQEKKTLGSKTYYFDNDGKMLTGWVNVDDFDEADSAADTLAYCDENGARVVNDWIYVYQPGVDEDGDDLNDYDEHWYYLGSNGKPVTGKKANVKGKTYLFNTSYEMLTGWVGYDATNDWYEKIGTKAYNGGTTLSAYITAGGTGSKVYFCDASNGDVKKDRWIKEWRNTEYWAADDDNDQRWFKLQGDGSVYIPDTFASEYTGVKLVDFESGELNVSSDPADVMNIVVTSFNNNKKMYAINQDGEMVTGFVEAQDITGEIAIESIYYFGGEDDGARKTGSLTIADDCGDSYKFYFATSAIGNDTADVCHLAAGVTGAMNGKLYNRGQLVKAKDYKFNAVNLTVNGDGGAGVPANFIVNGSGTIQTVYKKYTSDIIDAVVDLSDNKGTTSSDDFIDVKGYEDGVSTVENKLLKGQYFDN